MSQRSPFDKQASCPSCGAPMTFRFAASAAQVCKHCKFVVVRRDRDLAAIGKVADLVDLPSPLTLDAMGKINGDRFVVSGRVQLDRAAPPGSPAPPSAPWQEIFVTFPTSGRWAWLASAQGRWYITTEAELPSGGLPRFSQLQAGQPVHLGPHGTWTVAELGHRRVVSGEGELPHVAAPGKTTRFADVGGPNGAFGTLDYGDGAEIPPKLYLGQQIDPATITLDAGGTLEVREVRASALSCPQCGGNLPLAAPTTAERIVCKYCGMASDLRQGALTALRPMPRPPMEPAIPLGQEGILRGYRVICIGFMIRGCTVHGERYRWREYLLYAGPRAGYLWLMEEDGDWQFVTPIPPGEVQVMGQAALLRGRRYHHKQSVLAQVEHVIGEFYWKVEQGETVRANEYRGPGGNISVEYAGGEVTNSLCEPIGRDELVQGLRIAAPSGASAFGGASGGGAPFDIARTISGSSTGSSVTSGCGVIVMIAMLVLLIGFLAVFGGGSGGGSGGPSFGGPSFGGK